MCAYECELWACSNYSIHWNLVAHVHIFHKVQKQRRCTMHMLDWLCIIFTSLLRKVRENVVFKASKSWVHKFILLKCFGFALN